MSMLSRMASLMSVSANIEYVGGYTVGIAPSTANQTVSLTSLTGGLASQPSAGDFVIVTLGSATPSSDLSISASGYTQIAKLYVTASDDTILYAGYKFMGTTPDTSITIPGGSTSTSASLAVAVQVWRNVDASFPYDVLPVTATGTGTVRANPPAITPSSTGAVIIAAGVGGWDATTSGPTFTSADLSNFITINGPKPSARDEMAVVGMGSKAWTSGAFDAAQFGFTITESSPGRYSWCSFAIALRPVYKGKKPTFVASTTTQQSTGSTNLVISKPMGGTADTNTTEGDLMVAFMGSSNSPSGTWTGDTDWTEVADQGNALNLRVAYKFAGASEPSSYTFTSTAGDSGAIKAGAILTYRKADFDAMGGFGTNASNSVAPSVNISADFSLLLGAVFNSGNGVTISGPAGTTLRASNSDSISPTFSIFEEGPELAGASGTRTFVAGSSGTRTSALVSIKPAA